MTAEEFGEKYINEDILEIFDDACEFFSGEVPDDFFEEYDVEEILIEVRGQQENEKNFDKVLKFTDIIKNKQPELYQEVFQYYDDFLIDYYCFIQDNEQVKKAFSNFIEDPLQDFDAYLIQLNRVLFYQHTEILAKAVDKNYIAASNYDDLIDGAEFDLAFIKMYTTLQAVYESKGENPDILTFIAKMKDYDFDFKDSYATSVETGLLKAPLDANDVNSLFKKDKEKAFSLIRFYFLRYMLAKGVQFYVSAKITDRLPSYWQQINTSAKTLDSFFKVETESFSEFIESFSTNFFLSNESEAIATLWGAVHFYEFLHKNNYISQETFDSFLETSKILKGRIIARYMTDLWKSDFVHYWGKPDCISETEFTQEHHIFKKSVSLQHNFFTKLRIEISDELSEIGDLANYIIEGGKNIAMPKMGLLDNIFDTDGIEPQYPHNYNTTEPVVRAEKKIGRNDPCPCGSGKKYKKCCG